MAHHGPINADAPHHPYVQLLDADHPATGAAASATTAPDTTEVIDLTESINQKGSAAYRGSGLPKREEVVRELLSSELMYLSSLTIMVNLYVLPLRSAQSSPEPVLSEGEVRSVFSNVELLAGVSAEFVAQLRTRLQHWRPGTSTVGDVCLRLAPFFRLYRQYCAEHAGALAAFATLTQERAVFREFAERVRGLEDSRGLDLPALLIQPVQRLPRYVLLLRELIQRTPVAHADAQQLGRALDAFEAVAREANQAISLADAMGALVRAANRFQPGSLPLQLVAPARRLVRIGRLHKVTSRFVAEVECLLCNDLLLYAYPGLGEALRYKGTLALGNAWVRDLDDTEVLKAGFQLVCPRKTYTFYASSPDLKREWVAALQAVIEALVAARPELLQQRGKVQLTQRSWLWQAFTIAPAQFDPTHHREFRYLQGDEAARIPPAPRVASATPIASELETLPLLGVPADDPVCCPWCSCASCPACVVQ